MTSLKARVENGRLVLNEPTKLPEGTEVYLTFAGGDELDDEARTALQHSIELGLADIEAGRVEDASAVLAKLRAHSNP